MVIANGGEVENPNKVDQRYHFKHMQRLIF